MFKKQSITSGSHNWIERINLMLDHGICFWIDCGARDGPNTESINDFLPRQRGLQVFLRR